MPTDHEIIDRQGQIIRHLRRLLKDATNCTDQEINYALGRTFPVLDDLSKYHEADNERGVWCCDRHRQEYRRSES